MIRLNSISFQSCKVNRVRWTFGCISAISHWLVLKVSMFQKWCKFYYFTIFPRKLQLFFLITIYVNFCKFVHFAFYSGFGADPRTSKFEVIGKTKQLSIVGKYTLNGKVLILPIVGNGLANLTFGMWKYFAEIKTKKIKKFLLKTKKS